MKQSLILQSTHKMKRKNSIITPIMMYCIVSGRSLKGGKIDDITSE